MTAPALVCPLAARKTLTLACHRRSYCTVLSSYCLTHPHPPLSACSVAAVFGRVSRRPSCSCSIECLSLVTGTTRELCCDCSALLVDHPLPPAVHQPLVFKTTFVLTHAPGELPCSRLPHLGSSRVQRRCIAPGPGAVFLQGCVALRCVAASPSSLPRYCFSRDAAR